jgi:hypothetical protein
MLVPRDLPQVSPTTDTNFKLYDSLNIKIDQKKKSPEHIQICCSP